MDATKPQSAAEATLSTGAEGAESSEITHLIDLAKTGDADAFASLMRLYERRVIALGIHLGLSRDDALDACQDTFVKVFRYIHRFRSGESFFRWLYRISLNVIYNHLRRNRPSGGVSLEALDSPRAHQVEDPGSRIADQVENADLSSKLLAQLPFLSKRERIVFVMRDLQEMTTEEIGRVLGVSQITVRRHCMTARQKLRDRVFPLND